MKTFHLNIFLFFFFLITPFLSYSNDPLFVNYTIKDGLPSNEIYKIIKDRKGYIWIASDGGITRFDGKSFITFNEKKGLTDAVVFELFEDKKGRIWFTTLNQKVGYIHNLKLKLLSISFKKDIKRYQYFRSIYVDENENLWLGNTSESEIVFSKKPYIKVKFIKHNKTNAIYDFGKNVINCAYYEQLNSKVEKWKVFKSENDKIVFKNNFSFKQDTGSFRLITKVSENNYYLCSYKNLYQIKNGTVQHIKHFNENIISISHFDKKIYVGVYGNGMFTFNVNNNSGFNHFFGKTSVSSVIPYSEKGLIISTLNKGILLVPNINNKKILSESRAKGIIVNYLYTNDKNKSFYVDSKFNLWNNDNIIENKFGIENIFFDKELNELFLGGSFASRIKLDDFSEGSFNIDNFIQLSIKDFFKHKKSIFSISMNKILLNKSNSSLSYFCFHSTKILSADSDTKRNGIWYSTSDSVFFKRINSKAVYYKVFDSIQSRVNSIKVRKNGDLLIATKGNGLFIIKDLKTITQFSKENVLLSNTCEKIVTDDYQNQWIITNLGLHYIRANQNQIETPYFINHFFNQKIYSLSFYKNTLYLCSDKGVFKFEDYLSLMNYNTNLTTNISNFKLSKNNSNSKLSFDLECCSFENFRKFTYEYRLIRNKEPLKWVKSKTSSIVLSDLNYGNYSLEVRTVLNGNYKTQIKSKKFIVEKRFYQTWWFFLLSIFSIVLFLYLFYKLIQSQTKKRERKKQEIQLMLSQMESKALRAQMNPHFIFNAMNSIQNFLLSDQEIEAVTFLGKFARLIRNILESTKSELITIKNEQEILETYIELEQLRCSYSFDFEFNIDESISIETSQIPSMIIQPFIENAIIHGLIPLSDRKGLLQISFSQDEGNYFCSIEDNGIGRKQAQINKEKNRKFHTSMGMGITFDRIEQIQKMYGKTVTIQIEDKQDETGTLVSIVFPKLNTLN